MGRKESSKGMLPEIDPVWVRIKLEGQEALAWRNYIYNNLAAPAGKTAIRDFLIKRGYLLGGRAVIRT